MLMAEHGPAGRAVVKDALARPSWGLSLRTARHGGTLGARINPTLAPAMRDTQLFQLALGINSPWFVAASVRIGAGP